MKVAIVPIVYNLDNRIFILQIESIKRFCNDDFTIEVIDNSTNPELSENIRYHSELQGVNYRRTVAGNQDPSGSHSFSANLSYQILKEQYDYFFYLDHDVIPVKPFSVIEILDGKMIAGVQNGQSITKYFWAGCVMWDNNKIDRSLIDFRPNPALRTDTGGGFHKFIDKFPDECIFFDETGHLNEQMKDHERYYFYMMIYNNTFIHFLASSNWINESMHEQRMNSLIDITNEKINDLRISK